TGPQTADDDVDVDITSSVVAVRVGADNGGVPRKVFLTELQAQGLGLFQGQAVVYCVPRVEADDILVGLHVLGVAVLAVLPVCQQAGHGEGLAATFQSVQQITFPQLGLATLIENRQAGVLV